MAGNKDVVRNWLQDLQKPETKRALGQGNLQVAERHVDRRAFKHDVPAAARRHGRARPGGAADDFDSMREGFEDQQQAFPDLAYEIQDQVEEGDQVVTHWVARGTHRGSFYGIAATNNRVEIQGITINRVQGGKIVDQRNVVDTLSLMQQIGALPQ